MTDQTRVLIGRAMVTVAMVLAVVAVTLYVVNGEAGRLLGDWVIHNGVTAFALGAVAFLALSPQPRNGAVWVLAWAATFGALQVTGAAVLLATTGISNAELQEGTVVVALGDLDPLAAIGFMLAVSMWVPALFLMITLGLLLFPDGSPPSRRWLPVGWLSAIAMAATSLTLAWMARPWNQSVFDRDFSGVLETLTNSLLLTLGVSVLASVTALVIRWRRSEGESRLQFRWIGWALGLMALVTLVTLPFDSRGLQIVSLPLLWVIPVAYGVAITKYRLYDIDVVVNRTIVYAALAGFITVVYVGIVAGVGALFGSGDDPNALLAIIATAIVAVAFQPARRWLQRWANRLVYGKKATPYEVLAEFSRKVAATDDGLLEQAAQMLVDGTSAATVGVWARDGEQLVVLATWPRDSVRGGTAETKVIAVRHDGEELGHVVLSIPAGQRLTPQDERLATEVASGMGLAIRNQRLTETLSHRVDEIRESQRRIVGVQDQTRRRLERDLHDGAQQQLVALKVKLGLARQLAERDGANETATALASLNVDGDRAVDGLRDIARGIYPPLLGAEGLAPALAAYARRAPIPTTVDVGGDRYPPDIEATVYFCVLETLNSVAANGAAEDAAVTVSQQNGAVTFEILLNGAALKSTDDERGRLVNIADRVGAMSGRLRIHSDSKEGTIVRGQLPIEGSDR